MFTTLQYFGRLARNQWRRRFFFQSLHRKYRQFTMTPSEVYVNNLDVIQRVQDVPGCVIECGTWRGGMIAGIAEVLGPERHYYLFDSYEGLPPAQDVDGQKAKDYQANPDGEWYFDNCTAEEATARRAMAMSGVPHVTVTKGWFENSLADFQPPAPIALLRIDADWFDPTLCCLESLYQYMSPDGLILFDDYHTWDGCSRAVHYFLASHGYAAHILQLKGLCIVRPNFDAALCRPLVHHNSPPVHASAAQMVAS